MIEMPTGFGVRQPSGALRLGDTRRKAAEGCRSPRRVARFGKNSMNESKYEMIVYWSEPDKAFLVEVPELPGCMADGETREVAIKNASEVIRLWIETAKSLGREIPKPRGRLAYA
jgi:predicted RNase H-like HicB family nuclease